MHAENSEVVNSKVFVVDCAECGKCSALYGDGACEKDVMSVIVYTDKAAMKTVTRNFRKGVVKSVTRS